MYCMVHNYVTRHNVDSVYSLPLRTYITVWTLEENTNFALHHYVTLVNSQTSLVRMCMAGYMITWQHKTRPCLLISMHSLLEYIVQCANSCALAKCTNQVIYKFTRVSVSNH